MPTGVGTGNQLELSLQSRGRRTCIRGWHLHWMSGILEKHRGHIPLNGSSDSQVIGRGGCDRGLLGHACACARVLMCMLGCLSDLAVVGLRRKHSLLQWQEQGQFSASLSIPPSLLPVSRCLKAEGETLYAVEGFGQFYSWPCSSTVPLPCASCTCCCLLGSDRKAGLRSLQWEEALVAGPARCLPLPLGYTGA